MWNERRALFMASVISAPLILVACGGSAPADPVSSPASTPMPAPSPNIASAPSAPGASRVFFSGYTWSVRSDTGGPGPNAFSSNNVWVDANGFLHLRIAKTGGTWTTAEVFTTKSFGFGTYQFQLMGHPQTMDQSAVLGLFTYPAPSVGPDGTNEIDVEFATWGGAQTQHGNWTVWPALASLAGQQSTQPFDASLTGDLSTHRFVWSSTAISFSDMTGLTDSTNGRYAGWTFAPSNATQLIPQQAVPVHMNLWLYNGRPPSNGQGEEIVVTGFSYTP